MPAVTAFTHGSRIVVSKITCAQHSTNNSGMMIQAFGTPIWYYKIIINVLSGKVMFAVWLLSLFMAIPVILVGTLIATCVTRLSAFIGEMFISPIKFI